jgi:hypothetical protein
MKKIFTTLAENTQKQLKEQGEKHTMEFAAMKRANLDTQNLLTTKTTPAQTMNHHRTTAHCNAMSKPSETFLDRTPDNLEGRYRRLPGSLPGNRNYLDRG